MADFIPDSVTEIVGWLISPSTMLAWHGGKELLIDDAVFEKDDAGRFVHLLDPTARVRIGARYTLIAYWKTGQRPGVDTLRAKLRDLELDVIETPGPDWGIVWEIEPRIDTLTAGDVMRVLGHEGATAAGVFEGGAWRSPEGLKDIAERAQDMKQDVEDQLETAGDILGWWVKYWWVPGAVLLLLAVIAAIWWVAGAIPDRRTRER